MGPPRDAYPPMSNFPHWVSQVPTSGQEVLHYELAPNQAESEIQEVQEPLQEAQEVLVEHRQAGLNQEVLNHQGLLKENHHHQNHLSKVYPNQAPVNLIHGSSQAKKEAYPAVGHSATRKFPTETTQAEPKFCLLRCTRQKERSSTTLCWMHIPRTQI